MACKKCDKAQASGLRCNILPLRSPRRRVQAETSLCRRTESDPSSVASRVQVVRTAGVRFCRAACGPTRVACGVALSSSAVWPGAQRGLMPLWAHRHFALSSLQHYKVSRCRAQGALASGPRHFTVSHKFGRRVGHGKADRESHHRRSRPSSFGSESYPKPFLALNTSLPQNHSTPTVC